MTENSNTKPISILLVEDSETDVKIILRAFDKQKLDCLVHTAPNGQEALDYLQQKGQDEDDDQFCVPDIILLDINMPRMDGYTFVRELRLLKDMGDIPIIVFTTKEGMKDIFKIEGVDNYVMKSIDGIDLVKKVKELLHFKKEFFND